MKLIIFDIDGTLTNTNKVDHDCYLRAFEKAFGTNVSGQDWGFVEHFTDWGITEEVAEKELGRKPTKTEYAAMQDILMDEFEAAQQQEPALYKEVPGSAAFFRLIQSHPNYAIGIATGCWERTAHLKLNAIGIQPEEVPFGNSDHHISRAGITRHAIHEAEKTYGQSFEEIIYFGDGVWDFKTCKAMGIRLIGIDVAKDGKLAALGTKHVFHDYLDQQAILDCL